MGPLVPGVVFAGDYRVVQPLSSGGMGTLYVAEQLSTRKLRALKLMHGQFVADEAFRRRFEQEACIGARIPSEHVVEVQAAGVDAQSGLPYLVMELLEGENFDAVVRWRGPFGPAEVRLILQQVCHAVGAAHQAGIVHRDLKPLNLFMARSRRTDAAFTIKVLDFGIAKLLSERATETAGMGSPLWLAPEQAARSQVTPAADVWALGLVAFYLLTGFPFWRSADVPDFSVAQVMKEMLFDPIPAPSARAAERGRALPPGFESWLGWCLNRDPAGRFPDANQAFAHLAPLLPEGGVLAPDIGAPPSIATELRAAYEASLAAGLPTGASWAAQTGPARGASWGTATPLASGMLGPQTSALHGTGVSGAKGSSLGALGGMAAGCGLAAVLVVALALIAGGVVYFRVAGEPRVAPAPSSIAATSAAPVAPEVTADDTRAPRPASRSRSRSGTSPVVAAPRPTAAPNTPSPATATPIPAASPTSVAPAAPPTATPPPAAPPTVAAAPTSTAPSREVGRPGRRGKASTLVNGFDLPPDATSVLRSLEPSLKSCYERVIARDDEPHDRTSIMGDINIGPTGTVSSIDVSIDSTPPGVGTCALGVLRGARFSPTPKNNTVRASLIVSVSLSWGERSARCLRPGLEKET